MGSSKGLTDLSDVRRVDPTSWVADGPGIAKARHRFLSVVADAATSHMPVPNRSLRPRPSPLLVSVRFARRRRHASP